jgi:hypothetical protein
MVAHLSWVAHYALEPMSRRRRAPNGAEAGRAGANISLIIIVDFEMKRKTPTAFSQAAIKSAFEDAGIEFTSVGKAVLRRFAKGDKVQFKQFEPHIGQRVRFKVIGDGEVGTIVVVESPSLSSTLGDYRVSVRFKATIAAVMSARHFQLAEERKQKLSG